MLSDANGNYLGKEAADAEGFAAMYNNGKASANRVTADNVKLLSDGNSVYARTVTRSSTRRPVRRPRACACVEASRSDTTRQESSWNCTSGPDPFFRACRGIVAVVPAFLSLNML